MTDSAAEQSAHAHSHGDHDHDHGHGHDHGDGHGDDGHTHEVLTSPGLFERRPRATASTRDYARRAFTVGIGGPVGTGKTHLTLALCRALRERLSLCVVTNDIFTQEDREFLVRKQCLPAERIGAIETGSCPHAAIREDVSANAALVERMSARFSPALVFLESGGDNLSAAFSPALADYSIFVIDTAGGDDIPRKGGPGLTQSDLLVINKTDLADAVGVDVERMRADATRARGTGPVVLTQARHNVNVDAVVEHIMAAQRSALAACK